MDKVTPKNLSFKVEFGKNFENIGNSGFKKGICKIAYADKNRNYFDIPKESFEKALNSLALIPIVGNFKDGNFHGHDVAIELTGNNVSFKDLTSPIGVVPENHNAEWVSVEDENGNIKEYLQCNVVFWYERYKEPVQFIIDNGYVGQSMEICNISGSFTEDGYYKIDEFEFSALCLLGTNDNDPAEDVEPCFENAQVTISEFALNKDEFKSNFTLMMEELKAAYAELNTRKEEDNLEDFTNIDVPKVEKIIFELSHDDIRGLIWDKLNPIDEDGYRQWNYWILEVFDNYVIVQDETEPNDYYKIPYSTNENDELELGEKVKIYLMYLTEEEKTELENMRSEYSTLKELNANLQSENEQLRLDNADLSSFKSQTLESQRTEQETELFAKYDEILDPEDEAYKTIKENKSNFTIEQLEEKLAVIFARKQFKFSSNKNKNIIKLGGDAGNTGEVSPYGNLFEKHQININKEEI